eukprot:1058533-Prymnesium_polylepis.1
MPLFPRKKTFCTRLPIHVRLRRPEADEQASVTMSVVTTSGYRQSGRDAEPIEPPVTIATANGFQYVQDKVRRRDSNRGRRIHITSVEPNGSFRI